MWPLAARRLALLVPTVLGVATLTFVVLHLVPGDPVDILLGESAAPGDHEALRRDLGLEPRTFSILFCNYPDEKRIPRRQEKNCDDTEDGTPHLNAVKFTLR